MVSLLEMVTISSTGILGCVMNILSTCSFALPAALLARDKGNRRGLALGLLAGGLTMVAAMLLWNWLITPYYMGYPREAVPKLLLPFNLLKAGLNGLGIFLLCPPVAKALSKAGLIDHKEDTYEQPTRP